MNYLFFFALSFLSVLEGHAQSGPTCAPSKPLASELLQLNLDKRSTVGEDETIPLREKILEFLKQNPGLIVSHITVTAMTPKIPSYTMVNGKKTLDPQKNLSLAKERIHFAQKVLGKAAEINSIKVEYKAQLAGPDFQPIYLNERFVTKMTPGYKEKVNEFFLTNKKLYQEEALINSAEALLDENVYTNLYQAKFKPFHGFRIVIQGCEKSVKKKAESLPSTSKQ